MNLLEYIISRKNYRKNFPTIPDKEMIVDWLKEHGYDYVEHRYGKKADLEIILYKDKTGRNCYTLGLYSSTDTDNVWIRILCKDRIFFIRTTKNTDNFYEDILKKLGNKMDYEIESSEKVTFDHIKSFLDENS